MILVTGGLGYLGSHIALYLMSKGLDVVLVDNLSQSSMETLERLEYITKLYIPFVRLDVRNTPVLQKVFEQYPIEYVIHTASFKNLPESIQRPLEYYNNNLGCVMSILRAMQRGGVKRLVNLSSITVYGAAGEAWTEQDVGQTQHNIPYIHSQQMIEQILQDTYAVDQLWQILNLRLSNVVGAYPEGALGEWTPVLPKSLLPNLLQVAAQQKEHFEIYHQDLATSDGSAERNYIHVMDVVDALYQLMLWSNHQQNFFESFNVVAQDRLSLKQLISRIEEITSTTMTVIDAIDASTEFAVLDANGMKLKNQLGWTAQYDVDQAIQDQWHYYQNMLLKKRS